MWLSIGAVTESNTWIHLDKTHMFVYYEQVVNIRTALFCVVTQRVMLILYRRFFVGSWPLKMEPIVFPKRLLEITTTRHVMPQKSVLLIYVAAEG
jgi:hypothetical protein